MRTQGDCWLCIHEQYEVLRTVAAKTNAGDAGPLPAARDGDYPSVCQPAGAWLQINTYYRMLAPEFRQEPGDAMIPNGEALFLIWRRRGLAGFASDMRGVGGVGLSVPPENGPREEKGNRVGCGDLPCR